MHFIDYRTKAKTPNDITKHLKTMLKYTAQVRMPIYQIRVY